MTALTHANLQRYPDGLRHLLGQFLATPRWEATCEFWDSLKETQRITLCFHAQLGVNTTTDAIKSEFAKLPEYVREALVTAIEDLRAFASWRKRDTDARVSNARFIGWLTDAQRKTLYRHAGLGEREFIQPCRMIDAAGCSWRMPLVSAMNDLFHMMDNAPKSITAIQPDQFN
ncbi:hypothetical protein [Plesiomonas shigelloides]|uniref:hypothetical protein n=1 Tax=Plesiomonas shigelloides TaxID=703 RepID=UPI00057AA6FA|nr:hypothetical protein [Plesiomonas shigelloides]